MDAEDDDGARLGATGTAPHAAIGAEYAHVTAPLRRLVDRYGLEICLAHRAAEGVPGWVLRDLAGLPRSMARAAQRAGAYERVGLEIIEAAILAGRVGEEFEGVVVDVRRARDGEPGRGMSCSLNRRCAPSSSATDCRSARGSASGSPRRPSASGG